MEVFDPSPQVRCGGRARGQGAAPADLVGSAQGRRGRRSYVPGA